MTARHPSQERLRGLFASAATCTACQPENLIHRDAAGTWAKPLFMQDASGHAEVLVVAEAPNLDDTYKHGHITLDPETDPSGRFAHFLLSEVAGLDISGVVFTNSVLCLPAGKDGGYPVRARQHELCGQWLGQANRPPGATRR